MFKLNDNYYLRKCYFEREQAPTQSVMKTKMSPPLANVYFNAMAPKLKVLAGLEPPLKGGGSDWYVPPEELLKGRAVLKPIKKEFLSKLGCDSIGFFGEKLIENHKKNMAEEKTNVVLENDINWKKIIESSCQNQWEVCSKEAANQNTLKIQQAFHEFTTMYRTSFSKIELLLYDASVKEINRVKQEAYKKMSTHYKRLMKQQATMLYDRYNDQLLTEKANLKTQFLKNIEEARSLTCEKVHDIKVEKHVAIEKLRKLLECQNLACQVYVSLKEREECKKEMESSTYKHKKEIKALTEEIAMKDFEIRLAKEKESKRKEFNKIWQKKVCEVVKKFQMFVAYCLNTLPEHAEFFLNMEKLMLLQLNEAIDDPQVESIFVSEQDEYSTPLPKPHPFFLFCDKGYKTNIDQSLCPKHCTSSASLLPVIIVNKRYIYAACDNFDMFTDKITQYIHGCRGDDKDFIDDHDYQHDIPVKFTSSQQLLELKLESSLLQILQKELPNVNKVPIDCCVCQVPYCFCSLSENPTRMPSVTHINAKKELSSLSICSGNKIETRSGELQHDREPKWESFADYMTPRRCKCSKRAKKHLEEHLPIYMRKMSIFDAPDLLNYETCSLTTLKKLVKKAQGKSSPPPQPKVEMKTKETGTQYSDPNFDYLCTCFSEDEVKKLFHGFLNGSKLFDKEAKTKFEIVDGSITPAPVIKNASSFAMERAFSLKNLIDDSPQLKEIFMRNDCKQEK
ncbi:uncharacterized protein ACR2FA_009364 [Aphomia sociella]